MKYIFIFLSLLYGNSAFPQNFFTSFYVGTSNYQGDLSERIFELKHTHPAWGVGLLFELNPHMLIRGDFTYGRVSASDADGIKNRSRNLSFTSSISEFSLAYEYLLLDLYNYKVSPYVFAGIGIFKFSPYTKDPNNNLASLYELNTEGQGFYKERKKYNLTQVSIPFGGGVQWAISDNTRLGFVLGIRQTFTDYLDDVSKTYIDQDLLRAKRGGTAVTFAYRGNQLQNGAPYPADGVQRGNPTNPDWYYFSGLTLRVRLINKKTRKLRSGGVEKSRVTCPRPV